MASLWAVLVLLVALSTYGIVSGRLLHQMVWSPIGLQRLFFFLVLYWAWALGCYVFARRHFIRLSAFLGMLYVAGSIGLQGPVAVALILCSSLVLGDLIARRGRPPTRRTGGFVETLLALVFGLSVYVSLIGIAAHFSVNYPVAYLILFVIPLIVHGKGTVFYLRRAVGWLWRASSGPPATVGQFAAIALLVFFVAAHLLIVVKPEVGYDALAMHLVVPAYVQQHHQWSFDFRDVVWAVMPMGGDWTYTMAYLLGGEYAARLLNFVFLLITAGFLYASGRRWLSVAASTLVTAVFVSSPIVQRVTGTAYVENVLACLVFGAVVAMERFRRTGQARYLFILAVVLGTSLSVKVIALPVILVVSVFAIASIVRWRRDDRRVSGGAILSAVACAILCAVPTYLYAWTVTGNPVFPFMNAVFKSPHYPSAVSFSNAIYTSRLGWATPYEITFQTHKVLEAQDGGFAFPPFVLVPLGLLALTAPYPYIGWLAWAVAGSLYVFVFSTAAYVRYMYAALPLFLVPVAILLARLRRYRELRGVLVAVAVVGMGWNLYFLPASGWVQKGFYLLSLIDPEESRRYVQDFAPGRHLVEFLNLKAPGAPVAFFGGNNQIYGLAGEAFTDTWHDHAYQGQLRACRLPREILALMRKYDVQYFIAPHDPNALVEPVRSFVREYTTAEYSSGAFYVARLRDELRFTTDVVQNPGFEDGLRGWQMNGRVVYDPVGGEVRVSANDTLVQSVAVNERTTYRYAISARCDEPGNLLRLQVNWHDAQGRFITTSLYPQTCATQYETYVRYMTPPRGAVSGVVFVGGHTPRPVMVRRLSFTF